MINLPSLYAYERALRPHIHLYAYETALRPHIHRAMGPQIIANKAEKTFVSAR